MYLAVGAMMFVRINRTARRPGRRGRMMRLAVGVTMLVRIALPATAGPGA